MKYLDVVSRSLIALLFLAAGVSKLIAFESTVGTMTAFGFPLPALVAVIVIFIEIVVAGAFAFGYKRCVTGGVLIAFTILTIVFVHNNFSDSSEIIQVLKNIAIIGGILAVIGKCDCGKCPMSEGKSN